MPFPENGFDSVFESVRDMSTGHPCINQLVILLQVLKDAYPYFVG
jgi:hypothetical protein